VTVRATYTASHISSICLPPYTNWPKPVFQMHILNHMKLRTFKLSVFRCPSVLIHPDNKTKLVQHLSSICLVNHLYTFWTCYCPSSGGITLSSSSSSSSINCVNFWVFPRCPVYIGPRFGTLCQVHLQRLEVCLWRWTWQEGSETWANINQALGKHPKVDTVSTEHGESLTLCRP
jgi:hypothetical protein